MNHDLFICHASEDKKPFVRALAQRLRDKGLDVWYDEFSLNVGDSLRQSIEKGIRESRAGLVVLSHAFFTKEWPQKELDALFSREISGRTTIYPVWYGVTHADVEEYSPLLVDKVAIIESEGMDKIVAKIIAIFDGKPLLSDNELSYAIELFYSEKEYNLSFLISRSVTELRRMAAFGGVYSDAIDEKISKHTKEEEEKHQKEIEKEIVRTKSLYSIQPGTWLDAEEMHLVETEYYEEKLESWCRGNLGQEGSYELYWDFDEDLDTDYLLIFFSIPNGRVTGRQRERLIKAIVEVGSRNTDETPISMDELVIRTIRKKFG